MEGVTAQEKKALWQQDQADPVIAQLMKAHQKLMGLPDTMYNREVRDADLAIIEAITLYRVQKHGNNFDHYRHGLNSVATRIGSGIEHIY